MWGKVMFHSMILQDPEALESMVDMCKMIANEHAPEGRQVIFERPKIWLPPKKGTLAAMEITGLVLSESVTMPT